MKLGGGGRFKKLKNKLKKQGARNPAALAAHIGRKKYGKKKMASMAANRKGKSWLQKFGWHYGLADQRV